MQGETESIWARLGVGGAVALALLGLAASAVLLQHHVAVKTGHNPLLSSVCGMGEDTSCDEVLASEWGSVRGIPTALFGLAYFAFVASWFIIIGRPSEARRWVQAVPVLATVAGAAIAAGLAFVMYVRLPKWCPLCALTHICAWLLLFVSLLLWRRRSRVVPASPESVVQDTAAAASKSAWPPPRLLVIPVMVAGLAAAFGWSEQQRRIEAQNARTYLERWQYYESDHAEVYRKFMTQPQVSIPVGMTDSIRGSVSAPHTVVIFSDFQCEYCKGLDSVLQEKVAKYPKQLRVVYKHFPMNKNCNAHVTAATHVAACAAAVTAEAARIIGGHELFWKMHDELFAHQAQFARRNKEFMSEVAQRLGIDPEQLARMASPSNQEAWKRIVQHVQEGHAVGVTSTPAVFLDGRRVEGWSSSKFWDFIFWMDRRSERAAKAATQPG